MKLARIASPILILALAFFMIANGVAAQSLTGTLRGTVTDPQDQAVPGAKVTLTNQATKAVLETETSNFGVYVFSGLQAGTYELQVEHQGFATYKNGGIHVLAAQVSDLSVTMSLAGTTTTVLVETGANVVQTESSQITGAFEGRSISEIPVQTGAILSVLNLSVFLPNTTTQLGGTSGNGGSVGGLRGRQNSFAIDGTDNNDPSVTAASQQVIPDAVQELVINQNVYSAEYGRGSGGQFNVITKTGTNQVHFNAWLYNINRAYDAADNQEHADIANGTATDKRRFDFNRVGGDIGGPILKDRLFLYGAYEFNNLGAQATAPTIIVPTAAGYTALNTLAANQQVLDILAQMPVAPTADPADTLTVNGVAIPAGEANSVAPSFTSQQDYIINGDYNINSRQSLHARYLKSRTRQPSFGASFPQAQFASFAAVDNRRAILNHVWTATPHLVNDFRGVFARFTQFFPLSGTAENFPTLLFGDLGAIIGPNGNLPQHRIFNEYQLGDAITYTFGRHTLKTGGQYYWLTSPSEFLQNSRGQYAYASLQELINDQVPSLPGLTLQGVGSGFFSGNTKNFNLFVQDDIKVSRKLTLNLGVRYDFFGNPAGTKVNALNAPASLPNSPLIFRVPKQDWNNVGPRVGFAYDPTGNGKWSIRGGASVAYDVIPQNFYVNANPVQLQVILQPPSACLGTFGPPPAWCSSGTNFLADGAMHINFTPPTDQAGARAQTNQIMVDAYAPKVFSWSLGVQHEVLKNTSVEARYLGTRGVGLPIQLQLNSITAFDNGAQPLPTYFSASDIPATVPNTAPTLSQFNSLRSVGALRRFGADGFTGGVITAEAPGASSTYHGGAVELLHRFSHGLQLRANYTLAKTLDNATNDLNTSTVNPRRAQDSFDIRNEWARSSLDVRHKFALTWLYDLPTMSSGNGFVRGFANGWNFSGSYLFQTGQPVTIISGVDSNGNGDSAGDRAIFNPAGVAGTGSRVTRVCRDPASGATSVSAACSSANTVGYVANISTAQFVQAAAGTISNLGRNTFTSEHINLWNMAIAKNTKLTERFNLKLRVEAYNVFNHPNFSLGTLNIFQDTTNATSAGYTNLQNLGPGFLNPTFFNGGSRAVQLGLKLTY
jgi:outer membrane receptor protein involved in Fe transport